MADVTLEEALANLIRARQAYADADTALSYAHNVQTDALNELNRAQGVFDHVVAEIRKSAPKDSDWKKEERLKGT